MEGKTTAKSAITPECMYYACVIQPTGCQSLINLCYVTPHGTSKHTQHSTTSPSPHGITAFPNPTSVMTPYKRFKIRKVKLHEDEMKSLDRNITTS